MATDSIEIPGVILVIGDKKAALDIRRQEPRRYIRTLASRMGKATADKAREGVDKPVPFGSRNPTGNRTGNLRKAIRADGPKLTPQGYEVTISVVRLAKLNTGGFLRPPQQPQEYANIVEGGSGPKKSINVWHMRFRDTRKGANKTQWWAAEHFDGYRGKHYMSAAARWQRRRARADALQLAFGGSVTAGPVGNLRSTTAR